MEQSGSSLIRTAQDDIIDSPSLLLTGVRAVAAHRYPMHTPTPQATRSARNSAAAPMRSPRPAQVAWSRRVALLIAAALTVLAGQTGQGQSPPPATPDALK